MAQYDSNIVDAWKSGGKVDGKGVDDDRLLAHLKKRRDGMDPDDPMWDDWNNNFIQYDFAIHESKMALKNDQGKISDGEMANFYRKWAARPDVQKNSEFYRSLLSRAAKWQAAAKGRARGGSARSSAEAHQKWVDGYRKEHVDGAITASGYLLYVAKVYRAAPGDANSLEDIDPNTDGYAKFLDVIEDGKADEPAVQFAIDEMVKKIRETNPNFKWTSQSDITDLFTRADDGLKVLKARATTKTERDDWTEWRTNLRYENSRIKQSQANERIKIATDVYTEQLDNCEGDPYCARSATKTYRDTLGREMPNVVAGAGKLTAATADLQDATMLAETMSQLDTILAGDPVTVSSAGRVNEQPGGEKTPVKGYTYIDAAQGNSSADGWLGKAGNLMNDEKDMLDAGGWIGSVQMLLDDGSPAIDGAGKPIYGYQIMPATAPKPIGAVEIVGGARFTDDTRMTTGPQAGPQATGAGPVTVAPKMYVTPSPANIIGIGPNGEPVAIDPEKTQLTADGQPVTTVPWEELRGVKGPDGQTRTLYRTGDGTAANPYLIHVDAPVPLGTKANAQGQYSLNITQTVDATGKPISTADISDFTRGVTAARQPVGKSGAFVLGTFSTTGAALAHQSIEDTYAKYAPLKTKTIEADKYLQIHRRGVEELPLYMHDANGKVQMDRNGVPVPNPERLKGEADARQLVQVNNLLRTGRSGSNLTAAYAEGNMEDPVTAGYRDQLNRAGIVDRGEQDRRVALAVGIDEADERLVAQRGQGSLFRLGQETVYGREGVLGALGKEQEALARQKSNVFNPTISVSNIKVPGMPGMFQTGAPMSVGGIPMGAPRTAFPAPGVKPPAPKAAIPQAPTSFGGFGGPSATTAPKPPTIPAPPPDAKPPKPPEPYEPYVPEAPPGFNPTPINSGTGTFFVDPATGRKVYT